MMPRVKTTAGSRLSPKVMVVTSQRLVAVPPAGNRKQVKAVEITDHQHDDARDYTNRLKHKPDGPAHTWIHLRRLNLRALHSSPILIWPALFSSLDT